MMPTSFSLFTTQKSKSKPSTSSSKATSESKYEQPSENMPKSTFSPEFTTNFTSSPVVIPTRGHHDSFKNGLGFEPRKDRRQTTKKYSTRSGRRPHDVHSPDAIPPSVAALLAITAIPPPKSHSSVRRQATSRQRLTVDAILQHTAVSEKEMSITFGMSPMELLLSPPEEIDSTYCCGSENGPGSVLSSRTTSSESVPSLDDASLSDASTTPGSIITPSSRGRRSLPTRRYQPTFSGESTLHDHPLSDVDVEELDFRVFQRALDLPKDQQPMAGAEPPRRKSAFKSNLTASLRALRSAAKSFSSLTTPMITPDDFLTRSIMSIDPKVPFTDERMPPLLVDTPTPALRRYLNPTTNAPTDAHVPTSLTQTMSATQCTASIQMQTYKVSKSPRDTPPSGPNRQANSEQAFAEVATGPVARQRDMRENSDFIRIAVMEMAMRKNGKLDDRKPGRARWALPPRQASSKPYEIGNDGVPLRWTALTY
ncbi:52a19490-2123-40c4-9ad8-da52b93b7a8b-CDS [Sclerotinia trifoliorum]|uniref:52a19490-2123-40c4-9ad8-da52b93b7a8b-CDS n=1 Tax=Sclerotinia trifoliorum TaxID=28548 RepID=A0A8H2VTB1_9HELO|nr:52a19490-2123-40c4-9ad8-da52b93b7a8b-CDS [Sclerotinia trifoliorum]